MRGSPPPVPGLPLTVGLNLFHARLPLLGGLAFSFLKACLPLLGGLASFPQKTAVVVLRHHSSLVRCRRAQAPQLPSPAQPNHHTVRFNHASKSIPRRWLYSAPLALLNAAEFAQRKIHSTQAIFNADGSRSFSQRCLSWVATSNFFSPQPPNRGAVDRKFSRRPCWSAMDCPLPALARPWTDPAIRHPQLRPTSASAVFQLASCFLHKSDSFLSRT